MAACLSHPLLGLSHGLRRTEEIGRPGSAQTLIFGPASDERRATILSSHLGVEWIRIQ